MPSYKVLRKKDLEMLLEEIPEVTRGKIELEQYTIPSALAATILWILAFEERGLENKLVLDLGCGTGRLGLGALVMGAQYVVGLDLDYSLLEKARKSAKKLNVYQCFDAICADAHHIPLRKVFDVVVQNPPFG
ncbi:MAG: RNA methyltransferase, partial [Thermoprotei archaeon]